MIGKRKIMAVLMISMLLIGYMTPPSIAKGNDRLVDLERGTLNIIEGSPDRTIPVRIPIRATQENIVLPVAYVGTVNGAPYSTGPITFKRPGYPNSAFVEVNNISAYATTYMEFDIMIKETVKIGYYDVPVIIEFLDSYYNYGEKARVQIDLRLHITKERAPVQLTIDKMEYNKEEAYIGNTFNIEFTLKNVGEITALNTEFSLNFPLGLAPEYTVDVRRLGDLSGGASTKFTLPVTILSNCEEGLKQLTTNFEYKDIDGVLYTKQRSVYLNIFKPEEVITEKENSKITIEAKENYQEDILLGTDYTLDAILKNIGVKTASNIKVNIVSGVGATTGILPAFTSPDILVDDMAKDSGSTVGIPLIITKNASPGLHEIVLRVSYMDLDDALALVRTSDVTLYLSLKAPEEPSPTPSPTPTPTPTPLERDPVSGIDFSNVKQSPASPVVGETITVTYTITNTGEKNVTNVRVWGEALSSTNFEPLDSEPYQKVGNLRIGASVDVSMTFYVGKMINEGLNTLKIGYSYEDGDAVQKQGSTSFYILGVMNDSSSKPKLLITDFDYGEGALLANSEFTLKFDIYNTHISKAAKNIKVTVTSIGDVFSVVKGSNSFFVDKIDSGETLKNEIEMKVKSDIATAGYEIEIMIEYEYDNMSEADVRNGGVTDKSILKIQAMENARPVIQNPYIYNWYGNITVGQSSTLTFNFFNMGKSMLNNVYFTIDGDFMFEGKTMEYYGSMMAGNSEYLEYYVIPIREGLCYGTITVHFEDSNGTEVTKDFEISDIYVMPEQGYIDGPFNPGFPEGPVVPEPKKEILKLWMLIAIQAGIVVVFVPMVRMIGIRTYKRKLRRREMDG